MNTNFFRNICIGLVDGLTIPLALAAGLSRLVSSSRTVIIACLVAAFAGAMTMTIGGYFESRKYSSGKRPVLAGLTIGAGYLIGGIVTIIPYIFKHDPFVALRMSVVITLTVLFVAGYWESKLNGGEGWTNALRVCATGAIAALAAFFISKSFR